MNLASGAEKRTCLFCVCFTGFILRVVLKERVYDAILLILYVWNERYGTNEEQRRLFL